MKQNLYLGGQNMLSINQLIKYLRQLLAIFIHLYKKTFRCAVTTGILYDSFNACTILLTLSM